MKIFVTADTHFGHKNIIKYCNRPFSSTKEMDEAIKEIWNSLVRPKDFIFHLGDVTLFEANKYDNFLQNMNGKKILLVGNHDRKSIQNLNIWKKVSKKIKFNYKGIDIYMKHEPWVETFSNAIFLHGHSHGNLGTWHDNQIDMSVDCWNFAPVEIEEIIEFWKTNKSLNFE